MQPQPPSHIDLSPEYVFYDSVKEIESHIDRTFETVCFKYGFKQHLGECWNDAIQMFFCFQDGIREIIQPKLYSLHPENIIRLAEFKGRNEFLPKFYKNPSNYASLRTFLLEYLKILKERFLLYLSEPESNNHYFHLGISSPLLAISGARYGYGITHAIYNIDHISSSSIENAGSDIHIELLINILSFVFLDKDQLCVILKNKSELIPFDAINIMGSINIFSSPTDTVGHATSFFECNKIRYHYDDNVSKSNNIIQPFNYIDDYLMKTELPKIPSILKDDYYDNMDIAQILFIYKYTEQLKIIQLQNFLILEILHNLITLENFNYYIEEINKLGDITKLPKFNQIIVNLGDLNDYTVFSKIIESPFLTIDFINNVTDHNNLSLLLKVYLKNRWDIFSLLINKGVNVNVTFKSGTTMLIDACMNNNIKIVKELLDHGANVNCISNNGNTPVKAACISRNIEIVSVLLNHGANPNLSSEYGLAPLAIAIHFQIFDMVKELLDHGADPNYIDRGDPLIYLATKKNNLDIVRELLAHGADVNIVNEKGETALSIATSQEIKDLLLEKSNLVGGYYEKYQKYKAKYIKLKEQINFSFR